MDLKEQPWTLVASCSSPFLLSQYTNKMRQIKFTLDNPHEKVLHFEIYRRMIDIGKFQSKDNNEGDKK